MRRKSIVALLLGAALLAITWLLLQRPLLQVYWAVYARVPSQNLLSTWNRRLPGANNTFSQSSDLWDFHHQDGRDPSAAQPHASTAMAPGSTAAGNAADQYQLTEKMVLAVAPEGPVLVTWANLHYLDFVLNWVAHVRQLGIRAYLVGAMDDAILQELAARGINGFAMHSGLSQDDFGWGSANFHKMGREKIHLIYTFTKMGFDILVSDVDCVWLQDPLPYMARYPEAQILTSSDHLKNTSSDDGLELFPEAGSAANIGIMLFRSSAIELAKEWNEVLAADDKVWDQNAFNDLFRRGLDFSRPLPTDRTFWGYNGKLRIGILPVALFASGHTYFVQRMHETMGLPVYAVHATFQFSGTPGKRHRLRERALWLADGPDYYRPPGGLLAFDVQLGDLVAGAAPIGGGTNLSCFDGHFRLVNAQLAQIRAALALAGALGRALVLPELWCGADRWWAPHTGTIPGSALALPFRCPLDHVLDLEQMVRPLAPEEFGPDVAFREHSLLGNPRAGIAAWDILTVHICQAGQSGAQCTVPDGAAAAGANSAVALDANLGHAALVAALAPHSGRRVLKLTDVRPLRGALPSGDARDRLEKRTKVYTSLWCCVDEHPGHVWYDMWWDVHSHVDRFDRVMPDPWVPITGP